MRSKFKWIFTLLVAFTMQFSFAQQKTVTGTVTSEGKALPGATVSIAGTQLGTQTDENGKFSIKANQGDVLEIAFFGKVSQTATVGAGNVVNVTLANDSAATEIEVVQIAFGINRKKTNVASNYTTVKSAEINQAAAPNAVIALVGKVSGLQINTLNSSVNSTPRIVINGNRSITGNNQALIVIDNVVSTAAILQTLPPNAIENMNVIKGAQGGALYGEQGRNGVIIVNTKKGSSQGGKLTVDYAASMDFQEVAYLPKRQTRYGQGWFGDHIAIENGAWGAEMNGQLLPVGLPQADGSVVMAPYVGDDQNIKDFFRTGTVKQNTITLNGGTLKDGYAGLTIGRLDNDFIVKGDELKRTTFLFKAGKQLGKMAVEGNVFYSSQKAYTTTATLYSELLQTATNIPVSQFENSGINGHWNVYYRNPYWTRENVRNSATSDLFNGQANLTYTFNKNISAVWRANTRMSNATNVNYTNAFTRADDTYNSYANRIVVSNYADNSTFNRVINSDFLVNFDYELTSKLDFSANIGNTVTDNYTKTNGVGGTELNVAGFYNYTNVLKPTLASGLDNRYLRFRNIAVFGNFDFNYGKFLNLNLTARNDWTSRIDPGLYSVFYPSAGLTFTPTALDGVKGKVLNFAKAYVSYNKTGNGDFVAAYDINQIGVSQAGYPFGNLASFGVDQTAVDPLIKPEVIATTDFGLSLGFFNDRVTFDAQYFISNTTDLATVATTSSTSGYATFLTNIGALETKGYNVDLGVTPVKTDNFTWNVKANLSHNKSIVKELAKGADEINLQQPDATMGIFAVVGEEFPTIKGIGYQRDANGNVIVDATTGSPLYTDKFVKLGTANADYVLGLTNSLTYKNLKFTAVVDYRSGGEFFSATRQQLAWSGHLIESAENGRNGGFIYPGSVIDNPATATVGDYIPNTNVVTGGNSAQTYQEFFEDDNNASNAENNILDASAFKVRELSLNYSLGKKALKNTPVTAINFGINARNLFMVLPKANRNYSDPEASNTTGNAQGYSPIGNYPNTRTYGVSVNVTF